MNMKVTKIAFMVSAISFRRQRDYFEYVQIGLPCTMCRNKFFIFALE